MRLDELLERELHTEHDALPHNEGSLDAVIRRGARRRALRNGAATAIGLLLVAGTVGANAWLLGNDTGEVAATPTIPETWTTYTAADGLATDCLCDIAVATDGTVWTAALDGISRFDGVTWSVVATPQGLAPEGLPGISTTPDGAVWVSSDFAGRYAGGEWTVVVDARSVDELGPFIDVAMSGDGTVWTIEGDHMGMLEDGELVLVDEHFQPTDDVRFGGMLDLVIGPGGKLHVTGSTGDGVYRLYRGDATSVEVFDVPSSGILAVSPDGSVWFDQGWFDTEARLIRWDGAGFTTYPLGVSHAVFAGDGTGWFVGSGAIYRLQEERWTRFTVDEELAGHEFAGIALGADGSVWLAVADYGVTRFHPGSDPDAGSPVDIAGTPYPESSWPSPPPTTEAPAAGV